MTAFSVQAGTSDSSSFKEGILAYACFPRFPAKGTIGRKRGVAQSWWMSCFWRLSEALVRCCHVLSGEMGLEAGRSVGGGQRNAGGACAEGDGCGGGWTGCHDAVEKPRIAPWSGPSAFPMFKREV